MVPITGLGSLDFSLELQVEVSISDPEDIFIDYISFSCSIK